MEDKLLKSKANSFKKYLSGNMSFLIGMTLFLLGRSTLANFYVVPSGSMQPTISIGDRILVNRVAYDLKVPLTNIILKKLGEPERGQIVVFDSPAEPGIILVKRLIAVPGDVVRIENGFVYLNGKATAETTEIQPLYMETLGGRRHVVQRMIGRARMESFRFTVPEGKYFMMGDNRDNSADGRVFGFVSRELLIGEATRVLFSVDFHQSPADMIAWRRFGKSLL